MELYTLSQGIANKIADMIAAGELCPGQQIPNEQDLIEQFQVSRSTIREAIKYLVSKNILEIRRGKGTFVCDVPGLGDDPFGFRFILDQDLLKYLCEVRQIVEPCAAALAAQRATTEEINCLEVLAREIDMISGALKGEYEAPPQEMVDLILEKEIEFHNTLCIMSKNPILQRFIPILNKHLLANYTNLMFRNHLTGKEHTYTHYEICVALRERNIQRSKEAVAQHIKNSIEVLLDCTPGARSASSAYKTTVTV